MASSGMAAILDGSRAIRARQDINLQPKGKVMQPRTHVEKRLPAPCRLRRVPNGFGWADHRLLRDGHLRLCTPDAMALYLLLVLASDAEGVSFYGDRLACGVLGLSMERLRLARENLVSANLVAFDPPIYQVLEIPAGPEGGRHEA